MIFMGLLGIWVVLWYFWGFNGMFGNFMEFWGILWIFMGPVPWFWYRSRWIGTGPPETCSAAPWRIFQGIYCQQRHRERFRDEACTIYTVLHNIHSVYCAVQCILYKLLTARGKAFDWWEGSGALGMLTHGTRMAQCSLSCHYMILVNLHCMCTAHCSLSDFTHWNCT